MAALAPARPLVARVDITQNPEEIAADILDIWNAVEVALRALVGGSALGGQPLIQELRQQNMISIEQAHALLDFLAARDRVKRTEYRPTSADIDAAREAYNRLDQGLRAEAASAGANATATAAATPGVTTAPVVTGEVTPARRSRVPWLPIGALLLVLVAAGAAWFFFERGGPSAAMRRGTEAYRSGRLALARTEFQDAANARPEDPMPHIWLGRVARDQGDLATAGREISRAVQLEPGSYQAHRELGSYFLTLRNYDAARRSFVRALELQPRDRTSMGYLGCSLIRLNRVDEGQRFLIRAGQGPWMACAPQAPPAQGAPATQRPPA
ncbi:MAG TPA: tetratricopeptide repeat protein [Gemmatimonadaceae bacterium]|nr:tetratricopeptide repeat protein [Gemmatimonadaceae bacterium]